MNLSLPSSRLKHCRARGRFPEDNPRRSVARSRLSDLPRALREAFTVLELLVATAILAVIVTLLFSIFERASNAWIAGEANVDRQRSARISLELLSREMSQAFITTSATQRILFVGNTNWVYFVAPVAPSSDLYSDLGEFSYIYDASANSLVRWYSAPTDTNSTAGTYGPAGRSVTPLTPVTNLAASSVLAEGVVGCTFQYYDAGGLGHFSWNSQASTNDNPLPSVVEISLLLVDSRTAAHLPASGTARTNAIAQFGRTNSMIIRLLNAQ